MPLLHLILVLIVVGILLWLVNTYIPMDPKIKSILNAVVVICVIIWLLQVFGVLGALGGFVCGALQAAGFAAVRELAVYKKVSYVEGIKRAG